MRAFAAFVSISLIGLSTTAGAAESCDRACLTGLMTQYIDALVAHDPSKLPLAPNAKITEDSKTVEAGRGHLEDGHRQGHLPARTTSTSRRQVAAAHLRGDPGRRQPGAVLGAAACEGQRRSPASKR